MANVIVHLQNQIEEDKDVKIEFLYNDAVFVRADKQRIIEVVCNLLSNSQKFTEQGVITVVTKNQDNQVLVTVKGS